MGTIRRIKTGLAAFGMSGKVFHAPFIEYLEEFDFKYVVQRNKSDAKDLHPHVNILKSFEELINSDVELIIINTPTYLHYEMSKLALKAGKHVIVEKPMTSTSSEAEELIRLAKERSLIYTVYHNKRLEGDFLTLKNLIEENVLGQIKSYSSKVYRNKPNIGVKQWKEGNQFSGAGLLYDIGSHLIDQCLQLFGKPENIASELKTEREDSQVVDYFNIKLQYKTHEAHLFSDFLSKPSLPVIEITGSKAAYIKNTRDPQEQNLVDGFEDINTIGKDSEDGYGIIFKGDEQKKTPTQDGVYINFYKNLAQVILYGEQLLVKPEEGKDVIEIIEQIYSQNNL